jgi:signal transduction histidine kinase/ligand-binding sensor domain-containing protein/ActR/RegA family two-component response regulator
MQGRMLGWVVVVIVALMWVPLAQSSVPETPRFKSLKVEDGLPSSHVNFLAQTGDGYLWMGTKDGLARFDGASFKVYRPDAEETGRLFGGAISALHADREGRLWVAIDGKGVERLDRGSEAFTAVPQALLTGVSINAIATTRDGSAWFGTANNGLFRLSASGGLRHLSTLATGRDHLPSDEVLALVEDGQGAFFAGTGKGLVRWNGSGFDSEQVDDLKSPRVVMLDSDREGLWVGTTAGLRVRPAGGRFFAPDWQAELTQPVFATRQDHFGLRWLATSAGLMTVRGGVVKRIEVGASQGMSFGNTLLEDAEGGFWVAQRGYGVMYSPASWRRFSVFGPNSIARSTDVSWVSTFAESSTGGVWLAGVGGLDLFHSDTGLIEHELSAQALAGCKAQSMVEARSGAVWIGCADGLARFHPASHAVTSWTDRSKRDPFTQGAVESIAEGVHGSIWIVTPQGLQSRDAAGRVIRTYSIGELGFRDWDGRAQTSPDGKLWIETDRGIHAWNAASERFEPVPGLPDIRARAFGFGRPGVVWLLRDEVLEGYRWNGAAMLLDRRFDGLGTRLVGVESLFVDRRDRVWFTTARGLVRFDPEDASFRVYDTEDGLPSPEFAERPPLVTRNGAVFASTHSDFVVFEPGDFEPSAVVPTVVLETIGLRSDDALVELPNSATRIVLGPDDRDLRIVARIASLSEPRSRRFQFRLHGYDRDWIEDKEGERVFTRLEHGDYLMEVRAATADGVWSEPRRLEIVVLPRWWQTAWARGMFALAFVALLLAVRAAYRARLREQHERQSLEERRALAEQASQAKSRFLADLGHEIRTPMTGVLGMAELMHADAPDERQRTRIEAIQSAGRHLLVLLNDALDLARIEAGRLELQDVAFDLHALLADACALLRPQAEAKRLVFELDLAPGLPRGVRGDPVRLRQILLNLGHNAVKFTAAGSVRVRAGVAGDTLRIDVVDSGPGMDAARIARLFNRFEQADGARTAAHFGGSGLGLSICRELAQAMRGDIEVESRPGQGACFRVVLPLVPQALPGHAQAALRVREPVLDAVRILVVEDDALVGEVVCALLENLGHRPRRAAHGLDALSAVAADAFDLVLMDLDLPGLDGFELARLLRAQGIATPIVALTARADADAEARARGAGMVGFARKPVTGEMLAAIVARHGAGAAEPA